MSEITWWETIKAEGGQLLEKLKELVEAGNIRRIVVKQQDRTIAEFPLTVGVVGAVVAHAKRSPGLRREPTCRQRVATPRRVDALRGGRCDSATLFPTPYAYARARARMRGRTCADAYTHMHIHDIFSSTRMGRES